MPIPSFFTGTYQGAACSLDSGAVTLAAANTTAGAGGTIKLINGFVNPVTSGKTISIIRAVIATVSGTPAGGFFWNYYTLPAGITCTTTKTGGALNLDPVGSPVASTVTPIVNAVVVLSDASTNAFVELTAITGPTAVAAAGANESVIEDTNGRIRVPPGTVFGIAGTGAGTSHIVQSTITWEELPSSTS